MEDSVSDIAEISNSMSDIREISNLHAGNITVVLAQPKAVNPPGTPPGGKCIVVNYVGKTTWMLFVVFGMNPLVCLCPCDTMTVYQAPDGTIYNMNGAKTDVLCLRVKQMLDQ